MKVRIGCFLNESTQYVAFQDARTDKGDNIFEGYYLTDKETWESNLSNNCKEHPTVFNTWEEALTFARVLQDNAPKFRNVSFRFNYISDEIIPTCNMECGKCNKRRKYHCKHLRNPYQNLCGFKMAKFELGFEPEENRLDAPCEKCLTFGCPYNMNSQ